MIYVASDFHGCYDLYISLLDKIGLEGDDVLYILGDFLDRGERGHDILLDVMKRKNIISLIGNHDYTAAYILSQLNVGVPAEAMPSLRPVLDAWLADGGDVTLSAFRNLSPLKRQMIFDLIDEMPAYAEVSTARGDFVLCHAGIEGFEPARPLSSYDRSDFLFTRTDYTAPLLEDKILVTGHTPTVLIPGGVRGRIFKGQGHIAVDCGAVFGLGVGCICLDNMREYYVT